MSRKMKTQSPIRFMSRYPMRSIAYFFGSEFQAYRRSIGISQMELAELTGYGRHAISYWETKKGPVLIGWNGAARAMALALDLDILPYSRTSTRTQGDGVLQFEDKQQSAMDRWTAIENARIEAEWADERARKRVTCGAKTRKGRPCRNNSEPGKRRCKFHGGMSSGPKTEAGKERIAAAQRARWAKWRANFHDCSGS